MAGAHAANLSRPAWGAWIETSPNQIQTGTMKSCPAWGAWIETCSGPRAGRNTASRPQWARGLKLHGPCRLLLRRVAPRMGRVARLTHTVPTLDVWRQSARWDKDVGFGPQGSGHRVAPGNAPTSNDSADCAAEAGASIIAVRRVETL